MNTDDFEQRLRQQPLRSVPVDWKADILRAADTVAAHEAPRKSWTAQCWYELFWSCRRVWFGLAAVWGVILLLNVIPVSPSPVVIEVTNQSSVEFVQAFQAKQKQIMAELGPSLLPDLEQPKPRLSRPHSERRTATAFV